MSIVIWGITIERRTFSSGAPDEYYLINNNANPPLQFQFQNGLTSVERFQNRIDGGELEVKNGLYNPPNKNEEVRDNV